jgi:hypothetical protein
MFVELLEAIYQSLKSRKCSFVELSTIVVPATRVAFNLTRRTRPNTISKHMLLHNCDFYVSAEPKETKQMAVCIRYAKNSRLTEHTLHISYAAMTEVAAEGRYL